MVIAESVLASAPTRGEVTAARILDVAEALFARHGYEGTTLRDVAAGVGLRTPSLYNHFSGKATLYVAVLERGVAPVLSALSEFARDGSGDPEALVVAVMDLLAAHPDLPRLIQHEILSGGECLMPLLGDSIGPVFARAHEVAEASPGAGAWSAEEIPLLVLAMYHVVVGYFTIAPLYAELQGQDLLTQPAIERQTRFLGELVSILFSGTTKE